jgi:hypothetical protein
MIDIAPGSEPRFDLAEVARGYQFDNARQFAGSMILPGIAVPSRYVQFNSIGVEAFLTDVLETERAPGTDTPISDYTVTANTLKISDYWHGEKIDPSDTRPGMSIANRENIATTRCMATVLRRIERVIAGLLFNTTTFPQDGVSGHTAGTAWSNASAAIISDINTGQEAAVKRGSPAYNTMVITGRTLRDIGSNSGLLGRISSYNPLTSEIVFQAGPLAQMLGLERVVVVDSTYISSNEGAATTTVARTWEPSGVRYAGLGYTRSDLDYESPQLGRNFLMDVDAPIGVEEYRVDNIDGVDVYVDKYAIPGQASYVIRARKMIKPVVMNKACWYLIAI